MGLGHEEMSLRCRKERKCSLAFTASAPVIHFATGRTTLCESHKFSAKTRHVTPSRRRAMFMSSAPEANASPDLNVAEAILADEGLGDDVLGGETESDGTPARYMPSIAPDDPVTAATVAVLGGRVRVTDFELLDSRWNGNEVFRYGIEGVEGDEPPVSPVFAKLNRVESPEVFMSEAVSLTTLASTNVDGVRVPRPLHVGKLPRVGEYGPGAFMLLEWLDLVPFGASRPAVQEGLGAGLAGIHASQKFADVHKGRFGFGINNFLALTPQDNTWMSRWEDFFAKRLVAQVNAAFKDKHYGRAPLDADDELDAALKPLARQIVANIDRFFDCCTVVPSLLHGDLWIGNVGATRNEMPVLYDPASFFGHSEFDLALPRMFGGFTDTFWDAYFLRIPKAPGFETRATLYELFQNLNQLNLFGDPSVKATIFSQAQDLVKFLNTVEK